MTKLVSGLDVEIVGEVMIDNRTHYICKLNNATFVKETLIKYIVVSMYQIQEIREKLSGVDVNNQ